jgi:hypothetical protein
MRFVGHAVLVLTLALAGCAADGSDGSAPSSSSTSSTTSTTAATSTTTIPESTTTEAPPPGPTPVEQLDGLRPFLEGEGCVLVLERLNSPSFPASLRDRFASGFSGFVSAAGVVDITASSGTDTAADFDYYGFVTAEAGSELDQSTWFTLITRAQPPAGTPMFTVQFTRGPDGTFTCETFENLGGE